MALESVVFYQTILFWVWGSTELLASYFSREAAEVRRSLDDTFDSLNGPERAVDIYCIVGAWATSAHWLCSLVPVFIVGCCCYKLRRLTKFLCFLAYFLSFFFVAFFLSFPVVKSLVDGWSCDATKNVYYSAGGLVVGYNILGYIWCTFSNMQDANSGDTGEATQSIWSCWLASIFCWRSSGNARRVADVEEQP